MAERLHCVMSMTDCLKCDEAKPHCMRCQKSKRACPGYRDAFELNHRDETKSTKRKVPRALDQLEPPSFDQSSLSNSATTMIAPPPWARFNTVSISKSTKLSECPPFTMGERPSSSYKCNQSPNFKHLSTPIDQQATCFFLSNFVLLPQQGAMTRYLHFLIPLLKEADPCSPLDLTFSAVTLAAFGSRPNSRALLPRAEAHYVRALKRINQALKDPKTAVADSTLSSVILLSTFEVICSRWT